MSKDMTTFQCFKRVQAFKIHDIARSTDGGAATLYATPGVSTGSGGAMGVSAEYMAKHKPVPGGYYVRYADGYESYSPAKAFEEGYRPLDAIEASMQVQELSTARVRMEDLDAAIASEHYFTAAEGALGAYKANDDKHQGTPPNPLNAAALPLLTFCVLVLHNGFTVTGESACVSHRNFDREVGRRIAREKAIEKLWPLLGFQLKCDLYRIRGNHEPA